MNNRYKKFAELPEIFKSDLTSRLSELDNEDDLYKTLKANVSIFFDKSEGEGWLQFTYEKSLDIISIRKLMQYMRDSVYIFCDSSKGKINRFIATIFISREEGKACSRLEKIDKFKCSPTGLFRTFDVGPNRYPGELTVLLVFDRAARN